jgi:hypothetical protein
MGTPSSFPCNSETYGEALRVGLAVTNIIILNSANVPIDGYKVQKENAMARLTFTKFKIYEL